MARVKKRPLKTKINLFLLISLIKIFFSIEKHFVRIKNINYPKGQFILSIWHSHQCMIYSVVDKENFYVLISASNDGEMIAKAIECLKLKSVRGSSKRHGVSGALSLIEKIKDGASAAIMVDGPKGPVYEVKEGIVNIAKITGVPIVPAIWGSKNKTFLKFNTWDNFRIPFGLCKTIALFGEPIYIPAETSKEEFPMWCKKIKEAMHKVEADLEENFDNYMKQK